MADLIKVKEGISGSVAHEVMASGSVDAYISDQISRIDLVNPHLMKELCSFAMVATESLDPEDPRLPKKLRARMVIAGIMVYRMLESQIEADELGSLMGD